MLYIGIDWANTKHDALALDEAGQKLDALRVPHTAEGWDAWLSSLPGLGTPSPLSTSPLILWMPANTPHT